MKLNASDEFLSLRTFSALSALIARRSGLMFENKARPMLERRLAPRLSANQLENFDEYLTFLQDSESEQEAVYQILTTKETYFYRQEYQLRAFVDEIVPRLTSSGSASNRRLTIWSAGCSSGEEAYTLAMLLSESPHLQGVRTNIIGTDLCRSNIETAELGVYRAGSFRAMSDELIAKHFISEKGKHRVNPALKRMVHFSVGNLMNPRDVRAVGRVDVIFCRNVMIYFDEVARSAVTALFFERLLPGGYLLLGHSESLLNAGTNFEPVHLETDLVYRRPSLEQGSTVRIKVPT